MGPNPQQLSLPLLTGMRTLQATPSESSKAAPGSRFLLYAHVACPLGLPLTSQTDCQCSEHFCTACAGQLGCLKCKLDSMLGDTQLITLFDKTFKDYRTLRRTAKYGVQTDKSYQEAIVVSFLHSVASSLTTLSSSFALLQAPMNSVSYSQGVT